MPCRCDWDLGAWEERVTAMDHGSCRTYKKTVTVTPASTRTAVDQEAYDEELEQASGGDLGLGKEDIPANDMKRWYADFRVVKDPWYWPHGRI